MNRPTFETVAAAALAFSMLSSAAEASIIIDNFTALGSPNPWPQMVNAANPASAANETGLGASVLGGSRFSHLHLHASQFPFDNVVANIFTTPGVLDFNSSAGAGATLMLMYAGQGGLNANFTGQAGFTIDFLAFDLGSATPMGVTITMSDGTTTSALTRQLSAPGAQMVHFDFAQFSNIGLLNLASIQSVNVEFNTTANLGADFRVDRIFTFIPAPGAMAIGVLALLTPRRRRRLG